MQCFRYQAISHLHECCQTHIVTSPLAKILKPDATRYSWLSTSCALHHLCVNVKLYVPEAKGSELRVLPTNLTVLCSEMHMHLVPCIMCAGTWT